jgi:hypothetical protein
MRCGSLLCLAARGAQEIVSPLVSFAASTSLSTISLTFRAWYPCLLLSVSFCGMRLPPFAVLPLVLTDLIESRAEYMQCYAILRIVGIVTVLKNMPLYEKLECPPNQENFTELLGELCAGPSIVSFYLASLLVHPSGLLTFVSLQDFLSIYYCAPLYSSFQNT